MVIVMELPMTRTPLISALLFLMITSAFAADEPSQGETTCTFADGKQITVRYPKLPYDKKSDIPDGKPWPAESSPIYLFTQSNVTIGNTAVPAGAYSLYTVPAKDAWALVVSRDVKKDGHYDSALDLGREAMQTGELSTGVNALTAYFGRTGPDMCSLRLDFGKQRGYTDFKEK
jgi:hypothetical protein